MTLKEWLYSIGRTQIWLSRQLGENVRTVNSWATRRSNIPIRHEKKLRAMGFSGSLKNDAADRDRPDYENLRIIERKVDELRIAMDEHMGELKRTLLRLDADSGTQPAGIQKASGRLRTVAKQ